MFVFDEADFLEFFKCERSFDENTVRDITLQFVDILFQDLGCNQIRYMKFAVKLKKGIDEIQFQKVNEDVGVIHQYDHETMLTSLSNWESV